MRTTDRACRWVCRRLPLLAGGELTGLDRRRVERHLIGCSACRTALAGANQSLSLLRQVGSASRHWDAENPPTLWPDLARQIRESRHEARARTPWDWLAAPGPGRPRFRLALGLPVAAAGFALIIGALVGPGPPRTPSTDSPVAQAKPTAPALGPEAPALPVEERRSPPLDVVAAFGPDRSGDLGIPLIPVPRRSPALPDGPPTPTTPGMDPFLPPPTHLFDLERGTLVAPGSLNTQRAY